MSTATTNSSTAEAASVPPGATIICPGGGCRRQAKVKRDGTISSHYVYGKQHCRMSGKPAPAGVDVLRLPDDVDATLFDEMGTVFGALLDETGPVASAEEKMLAKVAKRHAGRPGMAEELQVLAARDVLGLSVEVYDGPANELWRVEGCKEKIGSEVAWWLFGGTYGTWKGRERPMFKPTRIAEAIAAGRYRAPTVPAGEVSRLVQPVPNPLTGEKSQQKKEAYDRLLLDGKLIDGAGRPLSAVDCNMCLVRRPHRKTSGVTCPYEAPCPTCQAAPNSPCTRPSGHAVSEAFGGLHASREDLAGKVDDARFAAGDLTVPAPWPTEPGVVNDDEHLAKLRADVDKPSYGDHGRKMAREAAERYAAGLPLVRHNRSLTQQWTFLCPVPTCMGMFDGHDTIREARGHWFEHAAGHDGFLPMWPDDVLPVEPEPEEKQIKRLRAAKSKRKGPRTAVIEIIEPVGNDWWDDSALAWEKCGLLYRVDIDTDTGVQPVAILSVAQGYGKAVGFAELLCTVGGLDPASVLVRTLDETMEHLDELRRERADARSRAVALRTVRTLDEVPPRPAGQVPTIVEVFAPPTGDAWWDELLAGWTAAGITVPWKYPPSAMWPGGVGTVKVLTPWDEPQATLWSADLAALAGLLTDRIRVYRTAASPEPPPGGVELTDIVEGYKNKPAQRKAMNMHSPASLFHQVRAEAYEILSTCTADTPVGLLAWAFGVKHIGHPSDVLRYLSTRKAADLHGPLCGGTLDGDRQHTASRTKGCEVYESTESAGHDTVAKVNWARIAKLLDSAVAARPDVVERIRRADAARGWCLRSGSEGLRAVPEDRRRLVEDFGALAVAELWQACKPAPAAAGESEVLVLFDLGEIAAAVDEAYAAAAPNA